MSKVTCNQCGKSWDKRVPHPKKCIYCGSRDWDKPKKKRRRGRR